MSKLTSCPTCGSKKIKQVRRNLVRNFRGQAYTVPDLEFHECPDCGERVYDAQAMRKIEAHSPAYAKTRARKKAA
jgi:YgiT-type zinc finger domain-containing protein